MPGTKRGERGPGWLVFGAIALGIASVVGFRDGDGIPTPSGPDSACKLHYTRFHFIWTIPPLLLLYAIVKPFLTALDRYKLIVLPIIALVWTTPWDNELVRQGAWWYPRRCVSARIGYVPVEEYAFFIIQSLMTTLFTILVTRWNDPARFTSVNALATSMLLALPCAGFIAGLAGLFSKAGNGRLYYISMIGWWSSVPLMLLWYGTRRSWVVLSRDTLKIVPWAISLLVPTVYLCMADVHALRRGTWHIEESKSLTLFVAKDLPVEEALFFFVTNAILVSACFAFDRVVWQIRSEDVSRAQVPLSPTCFQLNLVTIPRIWFTFIHLDRTHASEVEKLNAEATAILCRASKSFYFASKLLPWDLRSDLGCLYALARAMDDFIDRPSSTLTGSNTLDDRISVLRSLAETTFARGNGASSQAIEHCLRSSNLFPAHDQVASRQRHDLRVSAEAACYLHSIIPVHLWHELIDGYAIDNARGGPCFHTFEAQASYAQKVAGSIGEMCVRVVLARVGISVKKEFRTPLDTSLHDLTVRLSDDGTKSNLKVDLSSAIIGNVLRDARRMGVSLQLVNIARDVVSDARDLRRCYLVLDADEETFRQSLLSCSDLVDPDEDEEDVAALLDDERSLNLTAIYQHKIDLLRRAEAIYAASVGAIDLIPCPPAKTGLRVACAVYLAIGDAIRSDGVLGCMRRSHLTLRERCMVALHAVY